MHLNSSTPKSRIDDYPQTMINKLDILRNAMIARGVKYVICGGDIFHKAKQPSDFEYKVANEFLKFREAGIIGPICFLLFLIFVGGEKECHPTTS